MGHGIDDNTPGGISGGGTQEFVADVLRRGHRVLRQPDRAYDPPDYPVGEEVNLVGSGPIRYMYNPSLAGDANCYSSSIPEHRGARGGRPRQPLVLPAAEGTNPAASRPARPATAPRVTGLGIQTAMKILYNAMLMKTSRSSYLKYRIWTLQAAKNLYPGSCAEFNTVKAAWNAVSVPAQSADPTCGGTTPPPTGGNLLANPGFESGAASWAGTTGVITTNTGRPARTGSYKAWFGGNGVTSSENLTQTVTIPATATAANLSYWIRTDTAETGSTAYDTLKVQVVVGGVTTTLRTFSNVGTSATYAQFSHSLLAYKGKAVTVKFLMNEDSSLQTSFVVDDTAVSVS